MKKKFNGSDLPVRWLVPPLLVLFTFWAYRNSFVCPFIFDDIPRIQENPLTRHLSAELFSNSRALVHVSFYINYLFGGFNVADYHAFNLAVHVCAGLVLYGLIRRTLLMPSFAATHSRKYAALFAGIASAIWLVHPLQTESVTYIIQRSESMMGLFFLLVLYLFAVSLQSGKPALWRVLSIIACTLGMLTKEIMAVAPVIVIIYDRTFAAGTFYGAWQRRRSYYIMLGITLIIPAAHLLCGNMSYGLKGIGAEVTSPWIYLLTQAGVIVHYIRLSFVPSSLCLDYAWPFEDRVQDAVLPGLMILFLLGITFYGFARRRSYGFIGLWFFLILAPTSSILPISDCAFEHRLYLPLAAVVVLCVALGARIYRLLAGSTACRAFLAGILLLLSLHLVIYSMVTATRNRNIDYSSSERMWEDVARKRPDNFRAQRAVIEEYIRSGRLAEAESRARLLLLRVKSLASGENDADGPYHHFYGIALNIAGRVLAVQGKYKEAEQYFRAAANLLPNNELYPVNLAVLLSLAGHQDEAQTQIAGALDLNPHNSDAHAVQGMIYARKRMYAQSRDSYQIAVKLDPHNYLTRIELAWLLAVCSDDEVADAQVAVAHALAVMDGTGRLSYRAFDVLAAAYARAAQFEKAVEFQRKAIALAETYRNDRPADQSGEQEEGGVRMSATYSSANVDTALSNMKKRLLLYEKQTPYISEDVSW